jgi:glutamyl-tRNA reductase
VRKTIPQGHRVHIVGSGQLAQEIGIWLQKRKTDIVLYSRCPEKAEQRLGDAFSIKGLTPVVLNKTDVIVVATPISAEKLEVWMNGQTPATVIDLRDVSISDTVQTKARLYKLSDVFQEIEANRSVLDVKVETARQMITHLARERFQSLTIRPFGWDDLCA